MKIRDIDFDPPPSQHHQQQHYYDIRPFNHSISTIDSDGAFINPSHNNYPKDQYSSSSSSSSTNNNEEENDGAVVIEADNVSLTWSNAPGIEDSLKSDHTEYAQEVDIDQLEGSDGKEVKYRNHNDTDVTLDDDEEDESNSVFLNWPELPELPYTPSSPQHEQLEQKEDTNNEGVASERPWFGWGRRASDSDVFLKRTEHPNPNNTGSERKDTKKDDNDGLVPANQQWWQFGRRRATFDSYSNSGGRKSSAVESNVKNSGRWHDMESFMNIEEEEGVISGGFSNPLNGVRNDNIAELTKNNSAEETSEIPITRRPFRRKSITSNNSSFTSSVDAGEIIPMKKPPTRRKSIESNKSNTSSVDDEVNDWLFPRRGRRASVRASITGSTRNLMGGSSTRSLMGGEAVDPPQSQGEDEDEVEAICNKFRQNSVVLSPIDRVLLKDMASSKDLNRWQKRPSMSSHAASLEEGGDDCVEAKPAPPAVTNSSSREFNESLQSGPAIYWDSEKISKMKGEGVSLARAKAIDEISSIASSDHSGRIPMRNHLSHRRKSFTASFFGWSNAIKEDEIDDDSSFKPEKITPRVTAGKLSSMKSSSIRPKSMVLSTQPKALSKSKRRASIDVDDYDDDEMYSTKNVVAEQDLKHETVVKEANEIMNSVNNSVVAMGMNAPFRPIDEICPPFQKLHRNLGYQMDALNAAIVRSTTSPTNKPRKSLKKSKKVKDASFKSSQFSISSGSSLMDSSNQSSTLSLLNDSEALSKYILSQMAKIQSQQSSDGTSVNTNNMNPRSFYTSWLPNYMWYQTIAADASSVMRPTSLCSGTGITGDEQYLNPEMLKVFEMFSTYFVGSKHLFQEEDEDDDAAKMRRSYWMDTIEEEVDSDEESSESSSSSDSEDSDDSDMVYELGEVGTNIDQFVNTEQQIEILQTVINDLRKSQLNDRPFVSIKTEQGPESHLSSSTSSNDAMAQHGSNLYLSLNSSGRESDLSSSLTNDVII